MMTQSLRSLLRFIAPILGLFTIATGAPPPVSDFVKWPEISRAAISEDGRYVTFLTPSTRRFFDLNLYDLQTKESRKFDLGGDDVRDYWWKDEKHLVIGTENPPVYFRRYQLFDVSKNKVVANITHQRQFFHIVSSLRRDPNFFVARFYDEADASGGLAVINTRLQPTTLGGSYNPRFNVKEWIDLPRGEHYHSIPDKDGEIRMVTIYRNKQMTLHYRAAPGAPWKDLPFDFETTSIIGFDDDPDLLYIAHYSNEAKSSRLHRYRVSTADFGPALFEDPVYSLSEASLTQVRLPNGKSRVLALSYERDVYAQRAIDPVFAEVQKAVNAKLPGRLNIVHDCDYNLHRFVIGSHSGREQVRYVIYDRQDGSFLPLPAPTPWFKPSEMSIMRPIKYTARDGLELEGYLSLPAGLPAGVKPPLVVYPHGGPWARDTWGYNNDAQFLTSRGYAVFQPNYRGSSGYSKAVSKDDDAAFRKMHDDVTDGVRHLVKQGVVDEKRLAIYGGSFGGYLAVSGVAFEPDLYRCAVTFAGVFDWKRLIRDKSSNPDFTYAYDYYVKKLGEPSAQEERFNDLSPIAHIAAVKAPVFVVHGKLDDTVDYRQSTKLLSELSKHKVPHEKLFFDTEFHGFSERKNYEKFLTSLEKFLSKHL
jgi:dipeptidyl aminopeptidase/acylaminoacyl peptidase